MDFKELEYILVIAREKSISRAAECLYMSQPALSRFLLKLEGRLGVELFIRKNRQYLPSQAGELYLDMARRILGIRQEFDVRLEELLEAGRGSLNFGITPGRARTMLPLVIPAFHQQYPGIDLNVFEEDVETLEKYLKEGIVEAAFLTMSPGTEPDSSRFRYERIFREEVVLCMAKGSRYSVLAQDRQDRRYPWLDLRLVEHETFLLLKKNMRLGQFSEEIFADYQMHPKIMRLSSIDTALALVSQQYGIAFASSFRMEEHQQARALDIFSIGERVTEWDFVVVCPKDTAMKKTLCHLVNLMGETTAPACYPGPAFP
ncbi:MAG: LysR family transcriptional regulator [Lachnospiraceae bacterium]|jgi:DNA-binding transcriptional LysR family regulator|nr:LysR family transcriptional regulator [Lachnospiraceae bacterium]MCI8958541.1 LysR family transcriptional regulator [Lachnospiraceae bacterium]